MDTQLMGTIVSILAVLLGVWKIAKDFSDELKTTTALLFKRFDAHKEAVDKKFFYLKEINEKKYVPLNICDITRQNFTKSIDEMNRKLDVLLEERRKQ